MMLKIKIPEDFSFEQCLRFLNRNPLESTHRVVNNGVHKLLLTHQGAVLLFVSKKSGNLEVVVPNDPQPDPFVVEDIVAFIEDWFDLRTDLNDFYLQVKSDPILSSLVRQYQGLRLIGIPDLFEALGWAIIGQQINLSFAYQLKKRMVEAYGESCSFQGQAYYTFPAPEIIARLKPEALKEMQFSNGKATYLIHLAQVIASGQLDKKQLMSLDISEVTERLCQLKGIGPWSAHYAIMKCLRFSSAFPIADVGLHNAIKQQLKLTNKPTIEEIQALAKNWQGWESYATFYLWHSLIVD